MNNDFLAEAQAGTKPAEAVDPDVLISELTQAVTDGQWYGQRNARANDVRFCRWEGQSEDGKKHSAALGRPARPWEGSSDVRIRTADEIVNDEVRMLLASMRRAGFQAVAIGTEDLENANRVTQLLRWQMGTQMRSELRRELELAAQWREHYGSALSCVEWQQELRRVSVPVTLEDAAMLFAEPELAVVQSQEEVPPILDAAMQAVVDVLREREITTVLGRAFPLATRSELRKAVRTLREGGVAEMDQAEVFNGAPRWSALQTFVDVFFPVNTWDIQRARWVAHRELVTESELRNRIETQDYDPDWVEKAVKQKGSSLSVIDGGWWAGRWGAAGAPRGISGWNDEAKNLIEIFHFYYKQNTRGNVTEVIKCVTHPGVPEICGWSGRCPYEHGLYPYVVHQREYPARCILESRGVSELADTWQEEIKRQRDSRVDRTDLTTLPPVLVPVSRSALKLEFGPGAQWPKRKGEEFEWMRVPPFDQGSIEIEKATERTIDRYFGRISETNPADRAVLYQQHLVDGWLNEIEQLAAMTLQLDQQYLPDEIAIRVMGAPIRLSRAEIQGKFDFQMVFDVRNLNADLLKEKMELMNTYVLPLDRFGQVNTSVLLQMTLGAVDPQMAQMVLQSLDDASGKQVQEEQDVLTKMVAGMEPPMEPTPGMNYQLRLQTLQQAVQANPELQQMIQSRPILQQMIEARMQFLTHQVQQQQNAVIGRVGAQPVLQG